MNTLLFTLLVAAPAPASLPLLGQYADHGFVPPQNQLSEYCSVYADRVEYVIQDAHGLVSVVTKPITLDAKIDALVAAAAKGPIESVEGPTDGPARARFAVAKEGDMVSHIDLGKDVSGVRTQNKSVAAAILRRILEQVCPSPETL